MSAAPGRAVIAHLYQLCVRPLRGLLALLALTTLAANIATLMQPMILAALLSTLLGSTPESAAPPAQAPLLDLSHLGPRVLAWLGPAAADNTRSVPFLGLLFMTQVIVSAALTYAASLVAHRMKVRSTTLLQMALATHLLSQGLRFFHRERAGELLSRFVNDVKSTAQGIGPVVQFMLNDTMQIVLLGALLLSTSVWLTAGAAGLIALHFGLTALMKRPTRRYIGAGFAAWARLSTTLQEGLANIRVTKSFAAERFEAEKLEQAVHGIAEAHWKTGVLEKAEAPLRAIVDAAAVLGILLIAIVQLRAGALTTEGVLLYLYVGRLLIGPISHMATNVLSVQAVLGAYDRIDQLFAQRAELKSGSVARPALGEGLTVEDVSFGYGATPVLQRVSMRVGKGEMVALVGPSGAGKSTLVDLLLRLYDPDEGAVRLDGIEAREWQREAYLGLFGVVPQESLLFHDTIAANIRFGRSHLSENDVRRAASIANADGFITALPDGYDTVIGDRGVRLSGGERQRIAIARAVAHRPQILVLDEATSSLDTESERQVQASIDAVIKETTAIVIAHRLSTVMHADRIVVLEQGRVVDMGRHGELLQRCALYQLLCQRQFQSAPAVAQEPVA